MEWNKTVEHVTKALVVLLVAGASYLTNELNQAKRKSSELQTSLESTRAEVEELQTANARRVEELREMLAAMAADAENLHVDLAAWKHDKRMSLCQNTVGRLSRCRTLIEELDSGSNAMFRRLRADHRDKLSDHWSFSEYSSVMGGPRS